ncbi:hypothetical protein Ndes2526B_g00474 [Nannochloris sp. 'desiccata']
MHFALYLAFSHHASSKFLKNRAGTKRKGEQRGVGSMRGVSPWQSPEAAITPIKSQNQLQPCAVLVVEDAIHYKDGIGVVETFKFSDFSTSLQLTLLFSTELLSVPN